MPTRTPKALKVKSSVLPEEESQLPEATVPAPLPLQPRPQMVVAEFRTENGNIPVVALPKDFKLSDADRSKGMTHGSKGFYGFGKLVLNGRNYQVSVQLVETHSKG